MDRWRKKRYENFDFFTMKLGIHCEIDTRKRKIYFLSNFSKIFMIKLEIHVKLNFENFDLFLVI